MALRTTTVNSTVPVGFSLRAYPAFDGRLKYRLDEIGPRRYAVVTLDGAEVARAEVLESDKRAWLENLKNALVAVLEQQKQQQNHQQQQHNNQVAPEERHGATLSSPPPPQRGHAPRRRPLPPAFGAL